MDAETAAAIAELRHQLAQLRSAIGAGDPDEAETIVRGLKTDVAALAEWGMTVTPPFVPPGS